MMRHALAVAALTATLLPTSRADATGSETAWALLTAEDKEKVSAAFAKDLEAYFKEKPPPEEQLERKSLDELLAGLDQKEPWQKKYAKSYAQMALTSYFKYPREFEEVAGSLSAGDSGPLEKVLPKAASLFAAQVITDVLAAYDYDDTKTVWEWVVKNGGDLQALGKAFIRGNWGDVAKEARTVATKQAKQSSKDAIAGAVGWVFGPLGGTVGQGYVAALEAEVELLAWASRTLDRSKTGQCLDLYVREYRRIAGDADTNPGAADYAYSEFKMCSEQRGVAVGFRALEDFIRQNGLNAEPVLRQIAEDYRRGDLQFVDKWIAEQLEKRKVAVDGLFEREFSAAQVRWNATGKAFNEAAAILIRGHIAEILGEQKLSELEKAARDALREVQFDFKLTTARDGVIGACAAFAAAKAEAASILESARQSEDAAAAAELRVKRLPACSDNAQASDELKRLLERGQAAQQELSRQTSIADSEVRNACQQAEGMPTRASKDEAKRQLDAVTERAGKAEEAVEAGEKAYRELADAVAKARAILPADDSSTREALAQIAEEAELLAMGRPPVEQRLNDALKKMARALRTAQNLEGYAQDLANVLRAKLAPHRGSPLRAEIVAEEERIERALVEIADCRRDIADAWNNGEDGAPAWRSQRASMRSIDTLLASLAAVKAKCPDAPAGDPAQAVRTLGDLLSQSESDTAILGLAKASYGRCVREAVAAYEQIRTGGPAAGTGGAVLTRKAVAVDQAGPEWTVADGSITYKQYDGEHLSSGTFSWSSPPGTIGPQGFTVTMSVSAQTGKKQRYAPGIGISGEGVELVASAADRTPLEHPQRSVIVLSEAGQGASGSLTVHVMPRANYYQGEVVKVRIGAAFGPGVTYEYVAGKR